MYKVLQINSTANIGSTGRIAENIGKFLINKGWESIIAYGRNFLDSQSKLIKIGNALSIYNHVLITRIFDRHGFGSKIATINFLKLIDKEKPDIIHLHNIHGYYININILFEYLSKLSIPVVWTFHDCWAFTGHCTYFDYIRCNKWQNYCNNCQNKNKYPKSLIFDNSSKNFFDKKRIFTKLKNLIIVTPSLWLKKLVEKSFFKEYPIELIYNGIDLNKFKYVSYGKLSSKYRLKKPIILACASIWNERKGLKDIIEISKKLKEYNFIIVGVNKFQKNKIKSNNILCIERTEDINELLEFYSISDVFINPTYEDNFPTTNLEALACGTPVITYDTGGSPEAINENSGIIVKKGNIDGLVNAIKIILNNKHIYSRDKCIERAKFFNSFDRFEEYYKIYKKILNIK